MTHSEGVNAFKVVFLLWFSISLVIQPHFDEQVLFAKKVN